MAAFNPAKPKVAYQLTFGGSWPTAVAFLGSSNRLAAANKEGLIYLWDLPDAPPSDAQPDGKDRTAPNLAPVRRLDGHTNEVTHLAATPDGNWLVSASYDRSVRIWSTNAPASGKEVVFLDGFTRGRIARAADIKAADASKGIEVETQTACETLAGHDGWVYSLGMSGDGKRLITGDGACKSIVWDLPTRKPLANWKGQPWNRVTSAALSYDGSTAVVAEGSHKRDDFDIPPPSLKLIDAASGEQRLDLLKIQLPKFRPDSHSYGAAQVWRSYVAGGLIAAAFSPDGKQVALGQGGEGGDGKVHLIDTETGKLLRDVSGHKQGLNSLLYTSDGKHLLTSGRDTMVRILELPGGKQVGELGKERGGQFKDWLISLSLSPTQTRLAAADIAGIIHVWDFES